MELDVERSCGTVTALDPDLVSFVEAPRPPLTASRPSPKGPADQFCRVCMHFLLKSA